MTLDLFGPIAQPDEALHPKFKLLRDQPTMLHQRAIVEGWVAGFVDRDRKIVTEFQTSFHSSLWEFYLHRVLRDAGFTIDYAYDRPDFVITAPLKMSIEAVISEIRTGGEPESARTLDDILGNINDPLHFSTSFEAIVDEAVVRHSNSVGKKYAKYVTEYTKLGHIGRRDPYIIALGSYDQINYGREFIYPLLLLLYGVRFNPMDLSFQRVDAVRKPGNGALISTGLFRSSKYQDLSAVLFSCTVTIGKLNALALSQGFSTQQAVYTIRHNVTTPRFTLHKVSNNYPEWLSEGLFICHNPFAKNPLPRGTFGNTDLVEFWLDGGHLGFEANFPPICARLDFPAAFAPIADQMLIKSIYKYNGLLRDDE